MVYSSNVFIFLFLPAVLLFYYICPRKFLSVRNIIVLSFSLGFYFYGEAKNILVMLASILINYFLALLIHYEQKKKNKGILWLYVSIAANLSTFIYFKYLSFLTENINLIFNSRITVPDIIIPIGISFFTFQAMSYVFDVYTKTVSVQKNPINIALYISLFPQLIAGPIVRYKTIADEIQCRETTFEKFSQGIVRFIYGFAKKIIIADSMGVIADKIFATSPDSLTSGIAWLGAIAYSFQIFFDFSGYSDMAIGLGKMLGFTFLENFNFPYISKSITDFWRRWHISLGTWFRDYVYIPLGGNRVKLPKQIFNLFVVWMLTGLWHGAAWNFVIWGMYFMVILVLEKTILSKALKKLWSPFSHLYAIILIIIGWVIFRSDNLTYAAGYLAAMFDFSTLLSRSEHAVYLLINYRCEWIIAVLFSMPVGKALANAVDKRKENIVFLSARLIFVFCVFAVSLLYLTNTSFNPFIYFRF